MENLRSLIERLDPEWVELFKKARELGLTPEEIRTFLAYEVSRLNLKEEVEV
jgi:hypothetical protein